MRSSDEPVDLTWTTASPDLLAKHAGPSWSTLVWMWVGVGLALLCVFPIVSDIAQSLIAALRSRGRPAG